MGEADRTLILVVEDEPDIASLIRVNLELAGHATNLAGDGAQGLASAQRERPDLILLDVMMPVMDGWQTLQSLQRDPRLRDVPVVMLTALSEERDLIRGHLEGAVHYLTKPFEGDHLLRTVQSALQPPSVEQRRERRDRVAHFLTRLAELDSGRTNADHVHVSNLDRRPENPRATATPNDAERARLHGLTLKQRHVAAALAAGTSVQELANSLGVSRSNVYATRKRIARRLGVPPNEVGAEAHRLGLAGPPDA